MAGKKNRPRRLNEETKTWNVVFPVSTIERVKVKADEMGVTPAALVRSAVIAYVDGSHKEKQREEGDKDYFGLGTEFYRGVLESTEYLRREVNHIQYANGRTIGDVLADRIITSLGTHGIKYTNDDNLLD